MDKKYCLFYLSGYYSVALASELLRKYHIGNRIVKAPVSVNNGCRFAVQVHEEELEMAKYVFERENLFINEMRCSAEN